MRSSSKGALMRREFAFCLSLAARFAARELQSIAAHMKSQIIELRDGELVFDPPRDIAGELEFQRQLYRKALPEFEPWQLWQAGKNSGGVTIPQTMAYLLQIVDAELKNPDAANVLLALWMRTANGTRLDIDNEDVLAEESGCTGPDAVLNWRRAVKKLDFYGFLGVRNDAENRCVEIQLLNPHAAVALSADTVEPGLYARFRRRVEELGCIGDIQAVEAKFAQAREEHALREQARAEGQK